jgi:hypothetical protein
LIVPSDPGDQRTDRQARQPGPERTVRSRTSHHGASTRVKAPRIHGSADDLMDEILRSSILAATEGAAGN